MAQRRRSQITRTTGAPARRRRASGSSGRVWVMLIAGLAAVAVGGVAVARFMAPPEPTPLSPAITPGVTPTATRASGTPAPAGIAQPASSPQPVAGGTVAPSPAAKPGSSTTAPQASPAGGYAWDRSGTFAIHDAALAADLEAALAGVTGDVSLAVKDLGSGRGVMLGPNLELPAASIFKTYVLYSTFAAAVPLGEELEITERIKEYDLGTLELEAGETLTTAEALERMVSISDNSSAILLADRVGATRINSNLRQLGLSNTFYLTDRLNTSAGDMLKLLELMARGTAVSPAASAEMVHLLLRQRVNDRIPLLLPGGARIAHKTGNLPGVVNDVGIIYGQKSTVIVSVLISETTNDGVAARAIARVAEAAYDHYEALGVTGSRIPPQPARSIPPVRREPSQRTPTPLPVASPSAVAVSAANRR